MQFQNNQDIEQHNQIDASQIARLIFLGTPFDFSDRILNTLCREFDGIDVMRLPALEDVLDMPDTDETNSNLLIVAQSQMKDLMARITTFGRAAKGQCLVFAYVDVATGRQVRHFMRQTEGAPCVRYLPMRCSLDSWLLYIQVLLSREWVVPEELTAESVAEELNDVNAIDAKPINAKVLPRLTTREMEVLHRVSEGSRNKGIAHDLGLSEHTVKLHLHNIFSKLYVNNRAGAAAWYISHTDALRKNSTDSL